MTTSYTTIPPTKPGWYWVKPLKYNLTTATPVEFDGTYFYMPGVLPVRYMPNALSDRGYHWHPEPLTPPEE